MREAQIRVSKGYTLIEILIVMFIISIVATTALLSISYNKNKTIESFANQLTQILTLAEEQAMLQPVVLGVMVSDASLSFSSLKQDSTSKKNQWVPLQDTVLGTHHIPHGIQISVKVENTKSADDAEKKTPQIIISSNGEASPFTIYLGKPGEKPLYAIKGEADGSITNTALI